ncbi:glutaredoxin domain-containing protein [Microlunatus flavus]|uniref:Glutaredoxin n=1 Tax=Microlunatus flavus TaxID=1036181 RepID=A0A1H8ZL05_9ACTN|nr:glutaredoxin domain-containing protein [Microlunatus flavus]SEP64408.1 Glutaredoxin [Microlunatus flavus]
MTHAEAVRAAAGGAVVVYWRKGCPFTARSRLVLGSRAREAVWVDVWADPDASAYVRSVDGGDEVVPTVVIGGRPHTNPSPRVVARALAARRR